MSMMIYQLAPPLLLDGDCRQVSCLFDGTLLQPDTADQLGLALPVTLDKAVQKRKAEFLAGRYCARAALAQLDGSLAVNIGIGANREPLWPPGFVGSITHPWLRVGHRCAPGAGTRPGSGFRVVD